MYPLTPARITFDEEGTPRSLTHDDIYFLPQQGIAESEYVFLQGNRLGERMPHCTDFTIAELGFGTGLNFALTHGLWQRHAPTGATLTYIAIEKHPITMQDLERIHHLLGIAEETHAWRAQYPLPIYGIYPLSLGAMTLQLCWMEAVDACTGIADGVVDAWFLDGFAPAKNPDMWDEILCHHIARTLKEGGTFATFTAAGAVRRSLTEAGLTCEKIKGYGNKRHMVVGSKLAVA